MRTIYGLIGYFNSKRFWAPLGATAILATATVAWAVAPTGIFEIDGDSATGFTYGVPNSIGCDWDTLNAGKTTNSTSPTAVCQSGGATLGAYGFIVGAPGEPSFTTGGSKDGHDVSQWAFSSGSTPDKDTLTHGYAAAYTGSDTHNVLVFGAERFAVNGDSNIGIWFFQQNISIPSGAAKGSFSGVHVTGDILIVSAFTGGGGTSTISVYQWNPGACPNSNYPNISGSGAVNVCAAQNLFALFVDLTVGATGTCTSSSPACAVVNNQPITLGWPYSSKFGGSINQVPTGGFYEGGIDLTELLGGGAAPCFASFLFETRSSQSTTAVLKDFLVGSFPECHLSANKTVTCTTFSANGSFNYSYSGNVINDGGGDLFNVNVVDVRGQSYSCGNLPRGTSKVFGGSPLSADCSLTAGTGATFNTTEHPASNQATATADTSVNGSTPPVTADTGVAISTDAAGGGCTARPGLSVTKRCVTNFQVSGGQVVVRVDYTGEVTNTGNDNLNNVNVAEAASGTPSSANFGAFSLIPGQSICYTNGVTVSPGPPATGCPTLTAVADLTTNPPTNAGAASYTPNGVNILATLAGRISFSDTVTATGTDAFGQPVPGPNDPPARATAQCVICPFGQCAAQ